MLNFLQSIFASRPETADQYDEKLIEAATQRILDGTDPRLRSLSGYRSRLRDAVGRSVEHVIGLVDALPPALELQPDRYGLDPYLRAFFASPQHLEEVIGSSRSILDYVGSHAAPVPSNLFCGFGVEYEVRKVLGMEMRGEIMEREVAQEVVNFQQHRLVTPAEDESDCRWEIKKRAFDNLIQTALQRIVAARSRRSELQRQRDLLRRKLEVLAKGDFALGPMLGGDEADTHPDIAALERQIGDIESELREVPADHRTLETSLDQIVEVFQHPEQHLWVTPVELRINRMGVKIDSANTGGVIELSLHEAQTSTGLRRCFMVVRIPTPHPRSTGDFLKEASRYLG